MVLQRKHVLSTWVLDTDLLEPLAEAGTFIRSGENYRRILKSGGEGRSRRPGAELNRKEHCDS